MQKRRASTGGGSGTAVLVLIVVAVTIVVGAIVFSKNFTVLDGMRDSDFTAEANTTIAGVATDFWSGMDLLRIVLILIPAGIILAAIGGFLVTQQR